MKHSDSNNCDICCKEAKSFINANPSVDPPQVSSSVQQALKATVRSPWRFAAVAAQCFGLEVAPPGLYDTFKLTLLLSLVQTKTHIEGISHNVALLVLSTDTLIPDR